MMTKIPIFQLIATTWSKTSRKGEQGSGKIHNTGEVHEMLAAFEEGALSYKESQIEDDEIENGITWSLI